MFKLTKVAALDKNANSKSLDDLLSKCTLKEMWQFSFIVDIDWLLAHVNPTTETHIVYGWYGTDPKPKTKGVRYHGKQLYNQWASHHTKLMVLFFEQGCRIVVHTANMREFDWDGMCQGMWISPLLHARSDPQHKVINRFQSDLVNYLRAYGLSALNDLATRLKHFDFEPIKDTFIASVPSNSLGSQWGLMRLKALVPRTDLVVCQCSSVATLSKNYMEFMAKSLNCDKLAIVFPTVDQVSHSLNGWASGACLFLRRSKHIKAQNEQYTRLKPLMHEWRSLKAGRQMASPHIKTYTGFVGDKVKWILYTSANMSKSAWGQFNQKKKTFYVQNFEAGVLRVFDEPEPVAYMKDNKEWQLPYDWPLEKYSTSEAWTQEGEYGEDIHGNVWSL